jgi:hypothetical protein
MSEHELVREYERREASSLLDETAAFLRRFVVITDAQAAALALWVLHTHAIDAAESTPYISISSAEKRSGKTRLLEVLELLVARPWLTGRTTAAALVRKLAVQQPPTLLLDESDAAFNGERDYAETLRGVLNAGHRRGGCATLCVGQGASIGVRDFPVFGAKAIAGIGKLPDTVADRAVPIRLVRRAPGEPVERFRRRDAEPQAEVLRGRLEQFVESVEAGLRRARPTLPEALSDRAADGWEPLLAIADMAGGDWSERTRCAACELSGALEPEDDSVGVRLLHDIRTVFGEVDRLSSEELLAGLHALDESPWGDWYGKPLTSRGLAKLLRPYGIRSLNVRLDGGSTPKGFLRERFQDPWTRYLPQEAPSIRHSATTRSGSGLELTFYPPQDGRVADSASGTEPHGKRDVADVADRPPDNGSEGQNGGSPKCWTAEAADAFIERAKEIFPSVELPRDGETP